MSIDLEAFLKAEEQVQVDIKRIASRGEIFTASVLQWMLVQIDDLTKNVAELEAK